MASLKVTLRGGRQLTLDVITPGEALMRVLRLAGVDELAAMCGGVCACATCHVYVEDEYGERLPPIGDDEDALLAMSAHRDARSRLSCQIPWTDALDGMQVIIAPED